MAVGCGGEDEAALADRQVLRVNLGAEPTTLDPGLVTEFTAGNVLNALMDPLIKLNANLEPVGNLAERWAVAADGKTVTFHLRGDGRWTNGDPVTARDFEYSWKRAISPELRGQYAYQFYGIVGAQAYNACKKSCEALRDEVGIRALDDRTLQVRLAGPQPWFVQQTAHMSFLPVHRATVERFGKNWTEPRNIVTNGPFRLTRWEHDSELTLVKWEGWRAADRVELERVEGRMITDATTALQAFEAGEIDACFVRETCVPTAELERLAATPDYVRVPALGTTYAAFNLDRLRDVEFRRALAFAIDRETLVREVFKGGSTAATSFTPRGMPGFDVIDQEFLPAAGDLERAKTYLRMAKNPPTRLELVTLGAPDVKDVAVTIQSMWAKLGVTVRIRTMELAQLLQTVGPPMDPDVDVALVGWAADYVDAMNFLELFTCKGGLNIPRYCDARYDALLARARRTLDDDERHRIYGRAEAMLTGERGALPIAPIASGAWIVLRRPWVRGWRPNRLGQFDFTNVSIREH